MDATSEPVVSNFSLNETRVDYVAHAFVMPGLLLVGFVNQCLNVWTLSRLPSVGFLYLKASAIADILSIAGLVPFCMRHAGFSNPRSYPIMFYHAHLELPIINSFITASALCLVAMTVDRWLSIKHPIVFHNSPGSRSRIRTTIYVLYVIAFAVFLPSGVQKQLIQTTDDFNCTVWKIDRNHRLNVSSEFQVYLMFREAIARIGPILILVMLNLGMIRSLRQLSARYNRRSARGTRVREQDRTRISVLLLITSATFVLCTLPASILSIFIDHKHRISLGMHIFRAFANCLQVTHHLPHLYLYMLCSIEYRVAFCKLFGCVRQRTTRATLESPTYRLSTAVRVRSFRYLPAPFERRVRSFYTPSQTIKYQMPSSRKLTNTTSTALNNAIKPA